MSTRTIRVKVRGGRLEPLEELPLVEGSETTVTIELPEREAPARRARFRVWNLGLGAREITREDAYDDAV
jgi:hypothetical protein